MMFFKKQWFAEMRDCSVVLMEARAAATARLFKKHEENFDIFHSLVIIPLVRHTSELCAFTTTLRERDALNDSVSLSQKWVIDLVEI